MVDVVLSIVVEAGFMFVLALVAVLITLILLWLLGLREYVATVNVWGAMLTTLLIWNLTITENLPTTVDTAWAFISQGVIYCISFYYLFRWSQSQVITKPEVEEQDS